MTDERDAFDKWISSVCFKGCSDTTRNWLWNAWQARSSLSRQVTDEDVKNACSAANSKGAFSCLGGIRHVAMRAALESFVAGK